MATRTLVRRYISIDPGCTNLAICDARVTSALTGKMGSSVSVRINRWELRNLCRAQLSEYDVARATALLFEKTFLPAKDPQPDYVLVETQHRANRRTCHMSSVLMALFHTHYPNTTVHMPNGSLKVNWAVSWFGDAVASREKYKTNYSFNKRVARDAASLIVSGSSRGVALEVGPGSAVGWKNLFESSSKKDDLADCLLQALAFHTLVVIPHQARGREFELDPMSRVRREIEQAEEQERAKARDNEPKMKKKKKKASKRKRQKREPKEGLSL